jgi:hypothetical protein
MSDRKIQEAISKLAGTHLRDEVTLISARVTAVNDSERTCDVVTIGGESESDIPGVRLQAEVSDGLFIKPKIDSVVFIGYTKREAPYVCLFSEVDSVLFDVGKSSLEITGDGKIRLNDGALGGLTKTLELVAQLNKTNSLLQALITVLSGPPIPEAGNGAPSSLQALLAAALTGQQLGDYSQIENTQIIHGI